MSPAQRRLLRYLRDTPEAHVAWGHFGPFTEPNSRNAVKRTVIACYRRGWLTRRRHSSIYRISDDGRRAIADVS